ncbi:DUF5683 domain-containing protein [Proteiniphilum sp.]|uniref:DUF5683 domain-containing protein n=1 Tax=Proteiniphilum sp. TaxID=1926877 RepID=UPI002B1FC898|nr:DUF5683 domain-containing protein [Proteiniphilum sp.]MEA4916455.1 DUF5683 domain-containing protein [Proteiniphilum sp.]
MKNVSGILICLLTLFCAMGAQAQIHSPEQLQDSVQVLLNDSIIQQVSDSVSVNLENSTTATGKQDSVRKKVDKSIVEITSDKFFAPSYMFSPSPRKAVIYSAILPGLGQIYNRKYWKLPIIYGGVAGLTYAISWNNGYYRDYLDGYKDYVDENPETNRWHNLLPYGQTPGSEDREWFRNVLQQRKDYFRYYRDLSIIATVAVYLVFIVDAYVDAQLFDFDMSPDLSMRMTPVIMREERAQKMGSTSYGLQWSFNF